MTRQTEILNNLLAYVLELKERETTEEKLFFFENVIGLSRGECIEYGVIEDEESPTFATIEQILEYNNFNINDTGDGFELSQETPAGEDWYMTFTNLEDIVEYAEYFDPEEEFEFWANANCRGKPSTSELWEDQLWKQKLLNKTAEEVKRFKELKLWMYL